MVTLVFVKNVVTRRQVREVLCEVATMDSIVSIWTKRGYFLDSVQYVLTFN